MIEKYIKAAVLVFVCLGFVGCKLGRQITEYLPPRGETGDVVFATNFESQTWFWELGASKQPKNAMIVSADPANKFKPLDTRSSLIERNALKGPRTQRRKASTAS